MRKLKADRLAKEREAAGGKAPNALPPMPDINALSFTIRYLPGGRERFLEYVKFAAMNGDPNARAWWLAFADLTPAQRKRVNFDDVCEGSGVRPSQLISAIVGHGMEAAIDMGNLVAAALHPAVIAAAGKSAVRISGKHASVAAEDRKNLLMARGFLPVPKGASIHVHANASANAAAAAAASQDPSVPNFSNDIGSLTAPRTDVQRQLAEGQPPPVIDAEPVPAFVTL